MSEPTKDLPSAAILRIADKVATEENRDSKRMTFYRGEFPAAIIEFAGRNHPAEVYDLSTSGISVLPQKEIPGLDTLAQTVAIKIGSSPARKATLQHVGHIKYSGSIRLRLGFRMEDAGDVSAISQHKFPCQDSMPLAYCDDPIAFSRTILFNVTNFTENGLGLRTRCEDGALYPGLRLDLRLMMPARGEFKVVAEVISSNQVDKYTECQCVFNNASDALRNSVSEFLLMTTPGLTIKDLGSRGFMISDLEKAFLFRCVQTPSQFESVLQLRLKAAQKDGRWAGETNKEVMRDPWDKHARQVYCEINSRVVAAGRIVFNNGIPERSEHVNYGVEIPAWLWEAGFVECSRVCTDPDFRGTDLFAQVIQHVARIVTQSGHRYIVLNCVDTLVPVYKKTMGVFSLKKKFHTKFMQDRALNLLCIDIRAMHVGINFMPTTWILNAPVGTHLVSTGQLKLHWWEKAVRFVFTGAHRAMMAFARHQNHVRSKTYYARQSRK